MSNATVTLPAAESGCPAWCARLARRGGRQPRQHPRTAPASGGYEAAQQRPRTPRPAAHLRDHHKIMAGALEGFRNGTTQLTYEIAACLISGLPGSEARDQALAHSEDGDLPHARRLWGYLARRCVPLHIALQESLDVILTIPRCDRLRQRRARPLSAAASHVLGSYS